MIQASPDQVPPADEGLTLAENRIRVWMQEDPGISRSGLLERMRQAHPLAEAAVVQDVVTRALDRADRFGPISQLLDMQGVTDVCINGPGVVSADRLGVFGPTEVVMSAEEIDVLIERVLDPLGLRVDRTSPMVDARLPDGSRVNVIVPPLAPDGPIVTIRRFESEEVPLSAFGPPELVGLLRDLVERRSSLLVTGATGAGKTTLLNALGQHIANDERVVTIEDTAELKIASDQLVALEARPPNAEGVGEVTIRELLRNALRMRPDRIVVGEVRGAEALDLLLALNTGHAGSLATCHGHGVQECLVRLGVLAQLGDAGVAAGTIRELISSGIDHVIHVERVGATRRVSALAEVQSNGAPPRSLWSRADG